LLLQILNSSVLSIFDCCFLSSLSSTCVYMQYNSNNLQVFKNHFKRISWYF
jgi:hypothetical protein